MEEQHTISVLVANKFGALARIAGLFSGRGYNIESLTVNRTHKPNLSRMTIVTKGDDAILEQIEKQLSKLIDVESVVDLDTENFVERELLLIKIRAPKERRAEILNLAEIFGAKIPFVLRDEIAFELAGPSGKIENFISLISEYGIIEMARSGRTAISQNPGTTEDVRKEE